jgi:rubredoxin
MTKRGSGFPQMRGKFPPCHFSSSFGDVGRIKYFKEVLHMNTYRCTVCDYIYDPQKGDPDAGIDPGTPFEALPEDWVCPVCGVGKELFEKA